MAVKAIFITGTDTGVGKTIVCAGLTLALREKGIDVGVMKPIATGAIKKNKQFVSSDAEFLRKAAQTKDNISLINPYCIDLPLAPYPAFNLRKKNISVEKIKNCFNKLTQKHELVLVEGIGGLLVPILKDYLVSDLIKDLDIPLIIVSRNGLGAINHTLLTIKQAQDFGLNILGVVFNKTNNGKNDISCKTNPQIIKSISNVNILGELPYIKGINVEKSKFGSLEKIVAKNINLDLIKNSRLLALSTCRSNRDSRQFALSSLDKEYVWHPFTQMKDWQKDEPLIIEEARGCYLIDTNGKKYLDGVSSLWVNIFGHQKKELNEAIKKQLNKVAHSTLLGLGNTPSIELAEKLIEIAPKGLTKVFYSDNGSTSVEVALKMAFQYWQHKGVKQKTRFVYLDNSYHGDTIGSVSVGGIDLFHKVFHPLLFNSFKVDSPYCYHCPKDKIYPSCNLACLEKLEEILKNNHQKIAALIIEPIVQCAGGIITWPKGILKKMRQLCDKYNVLLILDEVAVGFGRTGKMFACEHEGISPDIMCLSKGLTAGYLSLAVTLSKEEIYNAFLGEYTERKTFFHGHSYTGNPLACAAALASLEIFRRERIIKQIQPKIKFLENELKKFRDLKHVGDIRQKGLIVGIELVKNKTTKEPFAWQDKIGIQVCQKARSYGVILRPLGNIIVLMPPLVITKGELKSLLNAAFKAIKGITENS